MGLPFDGERAEGRGAHVEFVIEIGVRIATGGVMNSGAFGKFTGDAEDDGIPVAGIDLGAEDGGDGSALGIVNGEAAETAGGNKFAVDFGEQDPDDVAFEFGVCGAGTAFIGAEFFEVRVEIVGNLVGEAEGEAFVIRGTDVDAVVERKIDGGNHSDFRNSGFEFALDFLDGVPFGLIRVIDMAADLHVVKRQIGLEEILAEGGDEFFELFGESGDGFGAGVGLTLIPENAADTAAGGEEAAIGSAVEGVALFVFEGGAPLVHGCAAVGAGKEADGDTGAFAEAVTMLVRGAQDAAGSTARGLAPLGAAIIRQRLDEVIEALSSLDLALSQVWLAPGHREGLTIARGHLYESLVTWADRL